MSIIGCDLHTRYQVVAWIDAETGEIKVRRLEYAGEEVRSFYAQWPQGTVVGIEATFPALLRHHPSRVHHVDADAFRP